MQGLGTRLDLEFFVRTERTLSKLTFREKLVTDQQSRTTNSVISFNPVHFNKNQTAGQTVESVPHSELNFINVQELCLYCNLIHLRIFISMVFIKVL